MVLDRDLDAGVMAIKLMGNIQQRLADRDNVLESADVEKVFDLVYCLDKRIAQAAGDFLIQVLFNIIICWVIACDYCSM
jgi:hypothetical protein